MRPFKPGRQHKKRGIWTHKQEEALSPIEAENKLSGEIAFFTS